MATEPDSAPNPPSNDRNDPANSDQDDPRARNLGSGRGRLGAGRRLFTPAELAAEAARIELLRLVSQQGTGATLLALTGRSAGASLFGGADVAPSATPGGARAGGGFGGFTARRVPDGAQIFGR